jgi:hypothetical protein
MIKGPAAQILRTWSVESQSKSYIASESYLGGVAVVGVIPRAWVGEGECAVIYRCAPITTCRQHPR